MRKICLLCCTGDGTPSENPSSDPSGGPTPKPAPGKFFDPIVNQRMLQTRLSHLAEVQQGKIDELLNDMGEAEAEATSMAQDDKALFEPCLVLLRERKRLVVAVSGDDDSTVQKIIAESQKSPATKGTLSGADGSSTPGTVWQGIPDETLKGIVTPRCKSPCEESWSGLEQPEGLTA